MLIKIILIQVTFLPKISEIFNNTKDNSIFQLFPYVSSDYGSEEAIKEIKENSNIQLIVNGKSDKEILILLDEFINDFREQNNLRKIESLEKKLLNNLDENSYSELLKLKSQLNRE